MEVPKLISIEKEKIHRLIPSKFPPISIFETVADPEDLDIVYAIESMTNDRIKDEVGILSLIPPEDRVCGKGSTPVMAAFTHIGLPTRFTDGSYGVYYGSTTLGTAIKETVYHQERFLSSTQEPDTSITMREYINQVIVDLHNVTEKRFNHLYDKDDYAESQRFAKNIRDKNSYGIYYKSVRDTDGYCVALFKPKAMTIPHQGKHLRYLWNGHRQKIVAVLQESEFNK